MPFKKGNNVGKKFTHEYQPESNGRKPQLPEIDIILAEVLGNTEGIDEAKEILKALRDKAKKGDVRAAEVLLNRAYGMAKQSIDHTTGGQALQPPTINLLPPSE